MCNTQETQELCNLPSYVDYMQLSSTLQELFGVSVAVDLDHSLLTIRGGTSAELRHAAKWFANGVVMAVGCPKTYRA